MPVCLPTTPLAPTTPGLPRSVLKLVCTVYHNPLPRISSTHYTHTHTHQYPPHTLHSGNPFW